MTTGLLAHSFTSWSHLNFPVTCPIKHSEKYKSAEEGFTETLFGALIE